MTKTRWRKDVTPDGVVTHTDPSGRVVIEKHTHHYGPWLIKDLDLDERVGETEVSEAEAKRLAEDYLASPRPVPVAPSGHRKSNASAQEAPASSAPVPAAPSADPDTRRSSMSYAAAVHALATQLRRLADEVEQHAVPGSSALSSDLTPHATSAAAAVTAVTRALSSGGLAQLATLAAVADLSLDRARRTPSA